MANISRLSVLVADGDIAQSRRKLELLGGLEVSDVVCVQDREAALQWLRARAFDVLLCSSRLGEHDGVELIQQARQVSPATRPVLIRPHSRTPQPDGVETLERPFSAGKLQALLSRAAAPAGGLWCEVPQLSLSDILQMYHQGRRSITVLLSGPIAGRIRLVDGELVHAETEGLEGLPALSRLLEADSGLLRTEPSAPDGPKSIHGAFESSVLAAAQLLDERQRDRASATPAAASHTIKEPLPKFVPPPSPEFAEKPSAPRSRRRPLIFALASVVLLVAVTLVFLVRNMGVNTREPVGARGVESDVRSLSAREEKPAIAPPPEEATAPASNELSAPRPDQAPPQQQESGATSPPAALPPSPSFELTIASAPPRARVLEAGKLLGRTPLTIAIDRTTVTREPREFRLEQRGHRSQVLRQGDSDRNVKVIVELQPVAATADDAPNGGAIAPPRSREPRPPRAGNPNLDIRMRR